MQKAVRFRRKPMQIRPYRTTCLAKIFDFCHLTLYFGRLWCGVSRGKRAFNTSAFSGIDFDSDFQFRAKAGVCQLYGNACRAQTGEKLPQFR